MENKLIKELEGYYDKITSTIHVAPWPTFLWDVEKKEIVTHEEPARQQYYKAIQVQSFQLSEDYDLNKWFETHNGKNIVFHLNRDSIYWGPSLIRIATI